MRIIVVLSLVVALVVGSVVVTTNKAETGDVPTNVTTEPIETTTVIETTEATEVTEPVTEPTEPVVTEPQYIIVINEEEAIALAKMAWGEARGVDDMGIAATMWCVLNRADNWNMSIIEVITAPDQFHGYSSSHPVEDRIYNLAVDVLTRWQMEKQGASPEEVGRVLPKEYMWFHGDRVVNHFRDAWRGGTRWDWSYPNPYETEES